MFLAQHTKARLALEISCQSQPAHSSAGWDMAATDHIYKRGKTTQTQSRKAPQLGKEPVTFSRKVPKAFQLGLFFSTDLSYKAVWEKEGIDAPEAVVKSTLQSSCSLCYLILILIEVFFFCPGCLDPSVCSSQGSQPQPAHTCRHRSGHQRPPRVPTACWGCSAGWTQAGLHACFVQALCWAFPSNAIPSAVKCLQIAKSLRDSKY